MTTIAEREKEAVNWYTENQIADGGETDKLVDRLRRLGVESGRVVVIGCGPHPEMLKLLRRYGYEAIGIEPVPGLADEARGYMDDPLSVLEGAAESIPLESETVNAIAMIAVLEHVDSVQKSLAECFRVLKPGGALYVMTVNRLQFSLTGKNGEFRVPFYNWLPRTLKEAYVFHHLHHDPKLANYTLRPAVHWFTYADLCAYGRQAGFAHFYSLFDLLDDGSPQVTKHWVRRTFLSLIKYNPWVKALALVQYGGNIFMQKRP